jgi:chromosomal replication initiator protein
MIQEGSIIVLDGKAYRLARVSFGEVESPSREIAEVLELCSKKFGIHIDHILSKTRTQRKVKARHTAMYLLAKYSGLSLVEIAHNLGIGDHASVIHARDKINGLISVNDAYTDEIIEVENEYLLMKKYIQQPATA